MANKKEIYTGRLGIDIELEYIDEVGVYGQGIYSTRYLYKGPDSPWPCYFWYEKDDWNLNGNPEKEKEYEKNFEINWQILPMDIAEMIIKNNN